MRRAIVLLGAVAIAALSYCAKHLDQLVPFPCAVDGTCPQPYTCVPGVGCRQPQLNDPCNGTSCLNGGSCIFGVCATQCSTNGGSCAPGYRCVSGPGIQGPGCLLDCTSASCPAKMTCVATSAPSDAGAVDKVCVWTTPKDGGIGVVSPPDFSMKGFGGFGGSGGGDMASRLNLPPPTPLAQGAQGGLSSDGTTIVWGSTSAAGGTAGLMRLSPSDAMPFQITNRNAPFLATTINGSTVYFAAGDGVIGSAPLAGGSPSSLVTGQPLAGGSQSFNFIQTDGTTLFWTTPSDPANPTGTIASSPIVSPSATALVSSVPQPSGLLRLNGTTYYAALGTSAKSYSDGVLTTVGGSTNIAAGPYIGDVQSGGGGNAVVFISNGAVMRYGGAGAPVPIYMPSDPTCTSSPCAIRVAVGVGKVYYIGAMGSGATAEVALFAVPNVPIIAAKPSTDPNNIYSELVLANGNLYWISDGTLYSHTAP